MLPNKWNNPFDKPTETITWGNKDYTFQANCSFAAPRFNYFPYFEVFITGIYDKGTVAIGLGGPEISGKDLLPGWKAGSYGYHADDGFVYLESGNGKQFGPTYGVGDTVGCGITSNNELYFTKNGQKIGVACVLPKTKLFPIMGLDKASVSTNFGQSAFKYNPCTGTATPTKASDNSFSLQAMTESTVIYFFSFLPYASVAQFAATNKHYFRIGKSDHVWKPLVLQHWPTFSLSVPVPSFYTFFKKRMNKIQGHKDSPLIENCVDWEFKCPATLDKLTTTTDGKIDFCSVCTENVYLVHDMNELKERVAKSQCVAIDFDRKEIQKREYQKGLRNRPMLGRVRVVKG